MSTFENGDTPIFDSVNTPVKIVDNTPNVIITNPVARRVARVILDSIGAALFITMAVDASTNAFDLLEVTVPIMAGWTAARSVFGLTVDNLNTPKRNA